MHTYVHSGINYNFCRKFYPICVMVVCSGICEVVNTLPSVMSV